MQIKFITMTFKRLQTIFYYVENDFVEYCLNNEVLVIFFVI